MHDEKQSYIHLSELIEYQLRMSKNATSFFYFTMEANEGIAFYSTMPFEKGQGHRDLIVRMTPELEPAFKNILDHLQKTLSITFIARNSLPD